MHTDVHTKVLLRNQGHASLRLAHAWFKNCGGEEHDKVGSTSGVNNEECYEGSRSRNLKECWW